jgi:glycosyltransferase involved in cell wall biosynthesis
MPAHNAEVYVASAVASVLRQSFSDFELIVVDDASTDSTAAIVGSFDDRRVRCSQMDRRTGPAGARNRGLALAQGRFVAFLDADDLAYPHRLATQAAYMDAHPDTALLGAGYDVIDASGGVLATLTNPSGTAAVRLRMLFDNVIATSLAFGSRDALLAVGPFDESLAVGEDHDMWARVASRNPIARLAEVLGAYREHAAGTYRAASAEAETVRCRVVCRTIESTLGLTISPGAAFVLGYTLGSLDYTLDDSIVALALLEALSLAPPRAWVHGPADSAAWTGVLIEKLGTVASKEPVLRGQALRAAVRMIRNRSWRDMLNRGALGPLLHLAFGSTGRPCTSKPRTSTQAPRRAAAREGMRT